MPVVLDGVSTHVAKYRHYRAVPFHKLAPMMRKCKVQLKPDGRERDTYRCDMHCDGKTYRLVLRRTKIINNTLHARVITAYAVD